MSKRLILGLLLATAVFTGMLLASHKGISTDLESQIHGGEKPDYMEAEAEIWQQMVRRFPRPEALAKPAAEASAIDVLHYNIAVRIFPEAEKFEGTTELIFKSKVNNLDKLNLWLDEARIAYVRDGDIALAHAYTDSTGELEVDFSNLPQLLNEGETDTLTIGYQAGVPEFERRVGAMISPRITYFAWNLWYPFTGFYVERDRSTTHIEITVPEGMTAVSNGRQAGIRENPDSTTTFRWELDFPVPGPATLVAAPYVKTSAPYGDISVDVYTFPGDDGYAQEIADEVRDILDFYSSIFCPYPFSKMAIAEIDQAYGGGYGAQSLLCLYENFFTTGLTERFVKFLAHEAAHQWWGHMIGFKDLYYGGSWLNEGFAEYSCLLYMEHKYGREVMLEKLRENGDRYLSHDTFAGGAVDDRAIVAPDVFESPIYSAIVYCKGSYIHHMLRYVVGDRIYFDIMGTYARELYGDLATVEEFQEICERMSGRDLGSFFDQWLKDTGALYYSVQDFYTPRQEGYSAKVRVFQGMEVETGTGWLTSKIFDMPVDITFHSEGREVTRRIGVDASVCEHIFELGSEPISIELDKDDWLLKTEVDYQFPIGSFRAEAGTDSVALSWKAPEMGWISGYNAYRREISGGEYRHLNPEFVPGLCYLDTTFRSDVFYSWVVTALDSLDPSYESLYSNPVSNYPWLAYDDGTPESFNRMPGGYGAVKFAPDSYSARIEKVEMYVYGTHKRLLEDLTYELCIWDDDGEGGGPGTLLIDPIEAVPLESSEWYVMDLSPYNLTLSEGGFYVGWRDMGNGIKIGSDSSEPSSDKRSWFSEGITWEEYSGFVSMIRVQVAPVEETQVTEASDEVLPKAFSLSPNFPNPFNPSTEIRYALPEAGPMQLSVFNLLGQEIRVLVEGFREPGTYAVRWDGKDRHGLEVATGVYVVRLEAGAFSETRRMVKIK